MYEVIDFSIYLWVCRDVNVIFFSLKRRVKFLSLLLTLQYYDFSLLLFYSLQITFHLSAKDRDNHSFYHLIFIIYVCTSMSVRSSFFLSYIIWYWLLLINPFYRWIGKNKRKLVLRSHRNSLEEWKRERESSYLVNVKQLSAVIHSSIDKFELRNCCCFFKFFFANISAADEMINLNVRFR